MKLTLPLLRFVMEEIPALLRLAAAVQAVLDLLEAWQALSRAAQAVPPVSQERMLLAAAAKPLVAPVRR
jgi:hypothetical protein